MPQKELETQLSLCINTVHKSTPQQIKLEIGKNASNLPDGRNFFSLYSGIKGDGTRYEYQVQHLLIVQLETERHRMTAE